MPRWHILRTLWAKEALRLFANRGGVALLLLLVGASMLLSLVGHRGGGETLGIGVQKFYVDHWAADDPLVRHLRANVPPELRREVQFRHAAAVPRDAHGALVYPQGTAAVQLRPLADPAHDGDGVFVWFWHPGADGGAIGPYEAWFWKEALGYQLARQSDAIARGDPSDLPQLLRLPRIDVTRSELKGAVDRNSGLATSLVLFGMFLVCVYLQSSLTCEERERGVLLAQALSPARPAEILAAKFLFYPPLGLALAAVIAGAYAPRVLLLPFFWLAVLASVVGAMGVGLTVASLAKTQRAASVGAMCYMLVVALLLYICQHNAIPALPWLALEYHVPRMLHAALTGEVLPYHWGHLMGTCALAGVWAAAATALFRKYGWQ